MAYSLQTDFGTTRDVKNTKLEMNSKDCKQHPVGKSKNSASSSEFQGSIFCECDVSCGNQNVDVSIIIPVHNAERWLDDCFQSIEKQNFEGTIEVSVYNDASNDSSIGIVSHWVDVLATRGIKVVTGGHNSDQPKGVGFAKNKAVQQSKGGYLCFLDSDDIMLENRINLQFNIALENKTAIIGSQFVRRPLGSTERFTKWANGLTNEQLYTQIYTSHGPTLIMPTWFCSRKVFEDIGGFIETGKGTPEDLIFFLKHLKNGGTLRKIDQPLLIYRYHTDAATFSVHEHTIWDIRINAIQENVINKWSSFTIWNAGKQGRRFYRSISDDNRKKVLAFCDVDEKKITKGCYIFEESTAVYKPKVAIVHYTKAKGPFIICVKQDLTGGNFESNLESLNLIEGVDYFHFN